MKPSEVDRLLTIYHALLYLSESTVDANDKQRLIRRLQDFNKKYPQIVASYYDQ